jgi:diguanylate cyclase (GGDEF)-like protein
MISRGEPRGLRVHSRAPTYTPPAPPNSVILISSRPSLLLALLAATSGGAAIACIVMGAPIAASALAAVAIAAAGLATVRFGADVEGSVHPTTPAPTNVPTPPRPVAVAPMAPGSSGALGTATPTSPMRAAEPGDPLHDPLTGLPGRALFRDRVAHALARANRRQSPVAVLLLDIDDFRRVNDTVGYSAGDRLLAGVATRVATCLRAADTAARIGADEFGLLLEAMQEGDDLQQVSRRIADALSLPFTVGTREVVLSTSAGIARATPDDDGDQLLRNADVALALAKRRGRGATEVFEPGMRSSVIERLELEGDLRRAIVGRQLTLEYQPIVILQNRRIVGVEALLRWCHPTRGNVPPSVFLPLAEELGLSLPLGRWALDEACRRGKEWQELLGTGRTLTVTVNISASQLRHPGFIHDVAGALRTSRMDPHRLVLEVSDAVMAHGVADAVARLESLKALGVRIAIDDFGTRQLSLQSLPGFPVDILKIDKSFVDRVGHDAGDATFAEVIVAFGKSMRLRTVAEGVEHEQQVEALLRIKCEFGQGLLFSHPLTSTALSDLLARELRR